MNRIMYNLIKDGKVPVVIMGSKRWKWDGECYACDGEKLAPRFMASMFAFFLQEGEGEIGVVRYMTIREIEKLNEMAQKSGFESYVDYANWLFDMEEEPDEVYRIVSVI